MLRGRLCRMLRRVSDLALRMIKRACCESLRWHRRFCAYNVRACAYSVRAYCEDNRTAACDLLPILRLKCARNVAMTVEPQLVMY